MPTKGRTAPAPTPASAWRATELVTLPGSGHVARLRRVSPRALLAAGRIPNGLADKVWKLARPESAAKAAAETEEQQRARFVEESEAFVYIAQESLVEPRLITGREPDYEAGEIGPEDIHDLDYVWLFYTWTEGARQRVTPFLVTADAGDA